MTPEQLREAYSNLTHARQLVVCAARRFVNVTKDIGHTQDEPYSCFKELEALLQVEDKAYATFNAAMMDASL